MLTDGFLASAFVTLFVVIDPIGLAPLFVTLTAGMTTRQRRAIALRACGVSVLVLVLFGAFGEAVLGFIGISMPAFQIAGGVLLFVTAFDMLFDRRQQRRESHAGDAEHDLQDDPSVFPLAIPLIAGPGAIASMILLTGAEPGVQNVLQVSAVMLAVVVVAFAFFMLAGLIERGLGKTGINVVTRLLGMLLAALSVQFVLDGLRAYGFVS
jgi:multiple antibiotic resistance protein